MAWASHARFKPLPPPPHSVNCPPTSSSPPPSTPTPTTVRPRPFSLAIPEYTPTRPHMSTSITYHASSITSRRNLLSPTLWRTPDPGTPPPVYQPRRVLRHRPTTPTTLTYHRLPNWQRAPHLVEAIFDLSVADNWAGWRGVSRHSCSRVNTLLSHVEVFRSRDLGHYMTPYTDSEGSKQYRYPKEYVVYGSRMKDTYIARPTRVPHLHTPFPGRSHGPLASTQVLDFGQAVVVDWYTFLRYDLPTLQAVRVKSGPRSHTKVTPIKPVSRPLTWVPKLVVFGTHHMPFYPGVWNACPIGFEKVVINVSACSFPSMSRIWQQATQVVLVFGPQGERASTASQYYTDVVAHTIASIVLPSTYMISFGGPGPTCTVVGFDDVEPEWLTFGLRYGDTDSPTAGLFTAIEQAFWKMVVVENHDQVTPNQLLEYTQIIRSSMRRIRFATRLEYEATLSEEERRVELVE